ncbi:MAG: molecular chaperone TorD family protein [Pirellulaceae bacterium]|nr:molecular chaperone TorD family protein [Pirellulaceae bacterium]
MSESADQYESLSNVYALLSRLWLTEVDADFLNAVIASPIAQTLNVTPDLAADPESIEQLATEYCRLFIGPVNHLPPFQSVWQQGQLQSSVTDSVKSFAQAIGFSDLADSTTLPDHLGIQLQIMSEIIRLFATEAEPPREYNELAQEFFHRHLTWPTSFLQTASARTDSDFYKAVIQLTTDLLESEQANWH